MRKQQFDATTKKSNNKIKVDTLYFKCSTVCVTHTDQGRTSVCPDLIDLHHDLTRTSPPFSPTVTSTLLCGTLAPWHIFRNMGRSPHFYPNLRPWRSAREEWSSARAFSSAFTCGAVAAVVAARISCSIVRVTFSWRR
jgi:hypothetical protein